MNATFQARLAKLEDDLWMFHLPVPADVAKAFLDRDHKRVVCTLAGGQHRFHCALMPKGDGSHFVLINKEIRQKLDLKLGQELEVMLEPDDSKYGLPMPEELETLLDLDEEGSRYFHQLTPGKQRSLIFIAGKPKRSETRLRKALVIVDYLKATQGKLDFKALMAAFKANS